MKTRDPKSITNASTTTTSNDTERNIQKLNQPHPTRNNICMAYFVYSIFSTPFLIIITMPLSIANYAYIVRNEIILTTINISFTYNRTKNENPLYDDCLSILSGFIVPANKATLYLPVSFYALIIFLIVIGFLVHMIVTCIKNKRFLCLCNCKNEITPNTTDDSLTNNIVEFFDRLFGWNRFEHKGLLIFTFAIIWPILTPILLGLHWRSYINTNRCASDDIYKDQSWYSGLNELNKNYGICLGLSFTGLVVFFLYFLSLIFFGLIVSRRN
jgi:hypothetical protein